MMTMTSILRKLMDALVYLIVVICSVLHFVPEYLLALESTLGFEPMRFYILVGIGLALMPLSLMLAVWCTFLMFKWGNGTPAPNASPKKLVKIGPYAIVRHPMVWALYIFLLGKVFLYGSVFVFVWLLVFARFCVFFIKKYEEPLLAIKFGEEYKKYCAMTPCWLPKFNEKSK